MKKGEEREKKRGGRGREGVWEGGREGWGGGEETVYKMAGSGIMKNLSLPAPLKHHLSLSRDRE